MTLIPDTAALYHGDDDGVGIHQRSVNQQSDSMAPKLPFDVNDYLNFELNEDFISSSGDFINDYSTSDSNHSDSCFSVHQSSSKSLDGGFNQLTYEMDIFDKENYDYEHDYNDISRYGEFNDDDDTCYLKNYKLSSGAQPTLPSNDFKIFEYDHKDFNCSVITKLNNTPCKNKITCNFHSIPEKSKVERCDSVLKLIKNFKYLQKLNEDISKFTISSKSKSKSNGYTAASRMKRHNSFNDSSHIKKKPQLLNPIDILNDNDDYYQNEEDDDEFINTLILKIGLLKNDPQERLLEFQYKTELKNLATIEYYNQNQFTL